MFCTLTHHNVSSFYDIGLKFLTEDDYYHSDTVVGCVLVRVNGCHIYQYLINDMQEKDF